MPLSCPRTHHKLSSAWQCLLGLFGQMEFARLQGLTMHAWLLVWDGSLLLCVVPLDTFTVFYSCIPLDNHCELFCPDHWPHPSFDPITLTIKYIFLCYMVHVCMKLVTLCTYSLYPSRDGRVSKGTSLLIQQLIELDATKRLTASRGLETAQRILSRL